MASVRAGYLTIRAERHDKTEGKHRTEFRYGSSSRSLPLPADANADDVKASYDHGILTVSVGLKAEKKDEVKKIEVKPAQVGSRARTTVLAAPGRTRPVPGDRLTCPRESRKALRRRAVRLAGRDVRSLPRRRPPGAVIAAED